MNLQELLLRTQHAADEARRAGFENSARAFDEIANTLADALTSLAVPEADGVAAFKIGSKDDQVGRQNTEISDN